MAPILFLFIVSLFDAEFIRALLADHESAWQTLEDGAVSPEQDLDTFADLTNRLARWVPQSLLQKNAIRLEGTITRATQYDARTPLYRCKMLLHDGTTVEMFTPSIPSAWKLDMPMQERSAMLGVYLKSYNGVPIYAAPAIQWFPDNWLGNLGFDVASFDQVPVSRVIELDQHDEETNRLMFKFTEADREPFYGLFRAVSDAPADWLEEEAKKHHLEMPFGITDLFNCPQETRGKPIILHGTAKRVVRIPVTDKEVQLLFGIDHYYQIFLFTEQSQGNPIVLCVRSLPEGMPIGDTDDFSEQITVVAVLYKLWIYETLIGPHYAPVLVGREPIWHPQSSGAKMRSESMQAFSYTVFFALVLFWFACRCWTKRAWMRQILRREGGREL